MLTITIKTPDYWDEENEVFVEPEEWTLHLEHSLVSLSKWESKWHKPFLEKIDKQTLEEKIDYIRCMTLDKKVDNRCYSYLNTKNFQEIYDYISDSMTATTISNVPKSKANREIMTSEVIYFYMTNFNIPFECEKWHLNRLIMLIRVCSVKNQAPKKMGRKETMSRNAALNTARRKQMNTKG